MDGFEVTGESAIEKVGALSIQEGDAPVSAAGAGVPGTQTLTVKLPGQD